MLPVTVQRQVLDRADNTRVSKANAREQRLFGGKFCWLVIKVIISNKNRGRQLRRGT